ncbi:lipopolysaccharide biosynthesis protein [Prevotella bivia]|uniref:lipopolysaccharide biosynthesis protein n=1 Tax=Prevotella bivia TaxID=28125 RepID=UPI002550BA92|nr:lipopolysaccharide biosynthesis protein [Prevotella bivia]MDZ3817594.1 lipopolysaccharide biosynthesis protein [Prevotella bivia]
MSEKSLRAKTKNGLLWSSVERFSTQGISFLFSLFLARLLMPKDYGLIAMLTIFISVTSAFIDSGFSNALIQKQDRTDKDFSTAFYFNIAVGVIAYLVLWLISPLIAVFYNMPILAPLTKVLGLTVIFSSLCVVQQAHLMIKIDFKAQAKISMLSTIISGIVGVVFAFYGYGVWALVALNISAGLCRMIFLFMWVRWIPKRTFSVESFKHLFSFGSKLLASGLLSTIYENLYPLIIGKFYSAANLGLFSRAQSLAAMPSSNISNVFQRVTFPVLSSIQNEDERLSINYRRLLRMGAFIIFPLMMLLVAISSPLVNILLTAKWSGCVIYLKILCFAMMWYPVHAINLDLLQVKGRTDLFLRLEIIKKVVGVVILLITLNINLIAMSIGMVVSSMIALLINTHYTGKLIHVGFGIQMKDLAPILINSLVMCGISYSVTLCFETNILKLVFGILSAFMVYFTIAFVSHSEELKYGLELIRKK